MSHRNIAPSNHEGHDPPPSHDEGTHGRQCDPTVHNGPDPRRRASQPQQHVRFSTDVDRSSPGMAAPSPTPDNRRRPQSLNLDTDLARSAVHALSARSPTRVSTFSLSPNSARAPGSPQIPDVGSSRTTRDRGFSLRRTIFAKGVPPQDDPGELELGEEPRWQVTTTTATAGPATSGRQRPSVEKNEMTVTSIPTTTESTLGRRSSTNHLDSLKPWINRQTAFTPFAREGSLQRKVAHVFARRLLRLGEAVRKTVLRIHDIPPSKGGRRIELDPKGSETNLIDERTGRPYVSNFIRSSRYSFWSFFPRQLVAQFSKLANFYFLIVAILQMIPGLSTTGTFTTFIPLMIFVGISMGKEGFDDWRRYRLDKEENNRCTYVWRPSRGPENTASPTGDDAVSIVSDEPDWNLVKWKDIKVGDIVQLERDDPVPADIVLLHANGPNGVAYIETMALDGETNLKSKQPCQPVAKVSATMEEIANNPMHFVIEDPNLDLYKFDGNVTVGEDKVPLTNNEIVYRGSILRNTSRAIGMVIYTGEECKIRMNANKNPRIKSPALQAKVNRVVILIVCLVVLLAVACTAAYGVWAETVEEHAWYLRKAQVSYGPIFSSFLIMFNTMVPISLYVSLEIVKVAQMFLLNDIDMYDEMTDTPLEARTSTINEELGQVSYIFSDKTGTLTDNSMRFRKMTVAGTAWFHDPDLREEAAANAGNKKRFIHKKQQRNVKGKKAVGRKSSVSDAEPRSPRLVPDNRDPEGFPEGTGSSGDGGHSFHIHRTTEMIEYIQRKPHTVFARKAKMFLLAIALCHTCIPERDDESGEISSFQAASPDELALVTAAREMGYLVTDRQSNTLTIRTFPKGPDEDPWDETYEILSVVEFSSARKRMSAVVRMPDNRICVFCKGADNTIMRLLRQATLAQEKALEVERRASERKTAEASEVIRRHSEYHSRKDSVGRTSFSRPSFTGRCSTASGRPVSTLRTSIDVWLRDRETDGGMLNRDSHSEYYSPRPSAQLGRASKTFSDLGGSPVVDDDDDDNDDESDEDLVEEALVVNEAAVFERCFQHLNDFATEGLRTLMYGHRFLDESTYVAWKRAYQEACTSVIDRQANIEKVGAQVEEQLELTGATAIEDKLQKGVPEAIDKLRRANIKLWMLTGDKRETAINIGHSCRLVKDYSTLVVLDHDAAGGDGVAESIDRLTTEITRGKVAHSVVVVDGQTLSKIESDSNKTLMLRFFNLAILVDSVICCRASPKQKAFLVKTIRTHVKDAITLAIGDGANDIAMIQEAHVGIGITGKEGLQAARISDYSIAQFRFLLKLLLVHGRWNYNRVCKYTLGTFWKEMMFYLTQALYQKWNGYTGTSLYEPWSLSMFNTLFTSLAVISLGIFTKDLSASTLLAVPELYASCGQQHAGFSIKKWAWWAFLATTDAAIIYFVMFGLFGSAIINITGNDVFSLGLLTFSACVIIINIKLQLLEVHNKTFLSALVMFVSVGGWFLWNILLSLTYKFKSGKGVYDVPQNFLTEVGRNSLFWAVLLLAVAAVLLYELTLSTVRAMLFPTDVDVFQAYERDRDVRNRFEEAAASELQQGWNREKKKKKKKERKEKKKSSFEHERMGMVRQAQQQQAETDARERERHVQDILAQRPRGITSSGKGVTPASNGSSASARVEVEEIELDGYSSSRAEEEAASAGAALREFEEDEEIPLPRRSVDIHELFSKGFGAIRKGHLR